MVNVDKLKGKIVENRMTISDFAAEVGMDKSTMYRRLSDGGENFLICEVRKIVEVLHLSESEAISIFFGRIVA